MSDLNLQALAQQGYNRVPVARTVLADLDTPLSVYLKLADAPFTYLLNLSKAANAGGVIPLSVCLHEPC